MFHLRIVFFSLVSEEEDLVKSWKSSLLAHRRPLLVALGIALAATLALGIGLGGQS